MSDQESQADTTRNKCSHVNDLWAQLFRIAFGKVGASQQSVAAWTGKQAPSPPIPIAVRSLSKRPEPLCA